MNPLFEYVQETANAHLESATHVLHMMNNWLIACHSDVFETPEHTPFIDISELDVSDEDISAYVMGFLPEVDADLADGRTITVTQMTAALKHARALFRHGAALQDWLEISYNDPLLGPSSLPVFEPDQVWIDNGQ